MILTQDQITAIVRYNIGRIRAFFPHIEVEFLAAIGYAEYNRIEHRFNLRKGSVKEYFSVACYRAMLQEATAENTHRYYLLCKDDDLAMERESAPEPLFLNIDLELLRECVEKLSQEQQTMIDLYYFQQLSYRAIAEMFGMSWNEVVYIISKAIKQLRKNMKVEPERGLKTRVGLYRYLIRRKKS